MLEFIAGGLLVILVIEIVHWVMEEKNGEQ